MGGDGDVPGDEDEEADTKDEKFVDVMAGL